MKQLLCSLLLWVMAAGFVVPPHTVTGKIVDDKGQPIGYATILIKQTSKSVSAARDGSFTIQANDGDVLLVSSIGYQTTEVPIGLGKPLRIVLKAIEPALNEAMVAAQKQLAGARDKATRLTAAARHTLVATAGLNSAATPSISYGYGSAPRMQLPLPGFDREGYDHITDNPYQKVLDNPLSTFSIDVDAASYSNVRRILKSGQLPQEGAVRVEELVNYFTYRYEQPRNADPFSVHTELAVCPWNPQHQLAMIGLQAKKIDMSRLPASNLVFLVDVSGSMYSPDKLPLVKESLKLLVDQLREEDRVSLVVYAGRAGLVLSPTPGDQKMRIREAIDQLEAGGSTAGGEGIQLAYKTAREHFISKGNNRVILCTDGDFNVGLSSDDALERMIEAERKSGVFLTVLGFGSGNYQDAKMQKLADKGNGNHAYIDQIGEAKKVFVSEFGGTLFTVAKDVKLQVEFNPQQVQGYRLIGYENRMLAKEDFNDDAKDAGELGSGHTVTALYEIVPKGVPMPATGKVDSLRYQVNLSAATADQQKPAGEVLTVKVRYKQPDGDKSNLLSFHLKGDAKGLDQSSQNLRFASSVASFGMLLRNSPYKGHSSYASILSLAEKAIGADEEGYRKEFLQLVSKAASISGKKDLAREE
ncbi:vWA domain-containing protein [Sediminibacterium soli]|uniref:vWA domain-containing protein n=1 Tax=Sediminibacterium soli TaxID=2698829 RepID=UPI00137A7F57|nr:VWA domain-containing protein [Sediminibacterium soli]NCI45999.1 DUF3520 domain-containing protein [Sediminibacterium soli]